jgi:hypothetical protein
MNISGIRIAIIREVAIIALCLLLGFAGTAFAGGEEDKKTKTALLPEEIELFKKLDAEYKHHQDEILEAFEHPPASFNRVEIYDIDGNLLKAIDLEGQKFSEQLLLPHAMHIITNGQVAVYMVL